MHKIFFFILFFLQKLLFCITLFLFFFWNLYYFILEAGEKVIFCKTITSTVVLTSAQSNALKNPIYIIFIFHDSSHRKKIKCTTRFNNSNVESKGWGIIFIPILTEENWIFIFLDDSYYDYLSSYIELQVFSIAWNKKRILKIRMHYLQSIFSQLPMRFSSISLI